MIEPYKIFGRLGNSMFQYAFLYSYALNHDVDFYYQDMFWFEDNKEAVRALFSANIPSPDRRVAIHVRRGDYVGNPFYVDLMETDYYERAMAKFPNSTFLVFSDDIDWCRDQEIFKDCDFSEGRTELEDMNKMASCRAHIICNSSFSWWGAWLSPAYPDNRVIAPLLWYTDGKERTVVPNHWERI